MTTPVDLDALEKLHASLGALAPESWCHEDGGEGYASVIAICELDCESYREETCERVSGQVAKAAVTCLDAFPALLAELRARREACEHAERFIQKSFLRDEYPPEDLGFENFSRDMADAHHAFTAALAKVAR